MLRDMTIGQFYPVDSPIHALDPRTKLMALVLYVATLFLVRITPSAPAASPVRKMVPAFPGS